jgi:hypothetical protein
MLKSLVAAILTVSLTFGAGAAPAAAVTAAQQRAWAETRAQCPGLANVDFARLSADDGTWRGQVRDLLRATDQPQLGDADIVIRFHAPPGFGGASSTWTTARRVNSVWWFTREERALTTASPEPPAPNVIDMRASRPRSPIVTTEGRLAAEKAAAIEAALADPCLAREPDSAPAMLPIRGGHDEICMDGAPFFLQIERAEGVRTFAHSCMTRWRAGEIMRALESAAGEAGKVTTTSGLTPLIFVDAQHHDVPESEAPPPRALIVSGDYAGRAMSFSINGEQVFEGTREAGGAAWTVFPPLGVSQVSLEFHIQDCMEAFAGELGEGETRIRVRGCRMQLN